MNRPQTLVAKTLDVLSDWSAPVDDAVLHAHLEVRMGEPVSLAEFRLALQSAEAEGLVAKVPSRRPLWTITHKGEAERLK